MTRCFALAAAALALCTLSHPAPAAPASDPVFLTCELDGRTIGGLVVFRKLKKLRIWYGDGGGEEWLNVDFTKGDIKTKVEGGRSIELAADFSKMTFNDQDGNEHSGGPCRVTPTKGKPARWFAPKLKQPFEK